MLKNSILKTAAMAYIISYQHHSSDRYIIAYTSLL